MQIYIDQSGKVEHTGHPTVVAFSNSTQKSLWIDARDKRKIQKVFREAGKPDIFVFRTFATLVFLLVENHLTQINSIIIDREYKGRGNLIKKYLLELIRRSGKYFDPKSIHFQQIGKKHAAHKEAISVFRGQQDADIKIPHQELLRWLL